MKEKKKKKNLKMIQLVSTVCLTLILFVGGILAVPPTPEAIEKWIAEGILEEKLASWRKIDSSHELEHATAEPRFILSSTATADAPDTLQLVVILIDFDDNPATVGDSAKFDSLLFSEDIVPSGSMTDFYTENSYGQVYVTGDVYGWYRADNDYSWYVGQNDGDNAGYLAAEAVWKADADGVDFRKYTGGVPGQFENLVVIHAGPGAETGAYGIWSHASSLPSIVNPDSVYFTRYTMQPETYNGGLSTVGVYCHEFGHTLGLPDYYDTDYDPPGSDGLGSWAVMAGGSWNGNGGDQPSHFCAYSKIWLGWVDPIYVLDTASNGTNSILRAEIPQVESEPVIYKLKNTAGSFYEYWLVENRQQVGFDAALPGSGLAIYHIDTWVSSNTDPDRYRNCLEEADGNWSLRYLTGVAAQAGDLWPGSTNNRDFTDFSWPNSKYNEGADTVSSQIGIWNISDSDSLMYADLEAVFTHPWPIFHDEDPVRFLDAAPDGDGDGVMEAGETITFFFRIENLMGQSFEPSARLTIDYPGITWITQEIAFGSALGTVLEFYGNEGGHGTPGPVPIQFTLPAELDAANVVCTLTVLSDATFNGLGTDGDFVSHMEFEAVLGQPGVLIVDDDNEGSSSEVYRSAVGHIGQAWGYWDKSTGSPTGADLTAYETVIWHTGDPITGGALTADDITALEGFLDDGGNLLLSSIHTAEQFSTTDPTFLSDYLHCGYLGYQYTPFFDGVDGKLISEGTSYQFDVAFMANLDRLEIIAPADTAFIFPMTGAISGLTYSGDNKVVFLAFPIEFIGDNITGRNTKDTLMSRIFTFFDSSPTGVNDDVVQTGLPGDFALSQNYPNPFNPSTEISYTIPSGRSVNTRLVVYNLLGREVTTLVDMVQAPGTYTASWNGTNNGGKKVSSGMYLYRLTHGDRSETRKMVLVK